MIFRVRHVTHYQYGSPVELGTHLLHLRPRELPHQRVAWFELTVMPSGPLHEGADAFGNPVAWLFLAERHAQLMVMSACEVEVTPPGLPDPEAGPAWEQVVRDASAPENWGTAEFLFPSPMVPATLEAGAYAAASFPPGRPVLAGLLDLTRRIHREYAFRPGVTGLSTPITQVLQRREGVCQDFTHLMIAGLRAIGLPARYVSGYLRTHPPPGERPMRGADQSHAWVGCWLGPEAGWIDLDPTNGIPVRDEHVVLGWGRDYSDVGPVRGVILGGGAHTLHVAVDVEPEGDDS